MSTAPHDVSWCLHVDEMHFMLDVGQDLVALKGRIVDVLRAGGGFVDFRVVGDVLYDVMITRHSRIAVSMSAGARRRDDAGATDGAPFDGEYWQLD